MAKMKKAQRGDTMQGYIDRALSRRTMNNLTADEYMDMISSSPTLQKIFRYSGNVGRAAGRSARGTGRGAAPSRSTASTPGPSRGPSTPSPGPKTVRGFRRKTGGTIKKQPKKK